MRVTILPHMHLFRAEGMHGQDIHKILQTLRLRCKQEAHVCVYRVTDIAFDVVLSQNMKRNPNGRL